MIRLEILFSVCVLTEDTLARTNKCHKFEDTIHDTTIRILIRILHTFEYNWGRSRHFKVSMATILT